MKKYFTIITFFLIILGIFCLFAFFENCQAADINVDDSGGADYTSIQAAINAANASDTINVASGTYNENIVVNKSLTIIGAGNANTKIIGVNNNENTVEITSNDVYITGFRIDNTNGRTNQFHCVILNSVSSCTVTNCIIENGENGLYLISSDSNTISSNTIQINNQKGIRLSNCDGNTINGNTIQNNGDGLWLTSSNSNDIYQNDILNNGYGVYISSSSSNEIYKNDFDDNTAGNAYDTSTNSWSKNQQGNYWDDYDDYDSDNDDIGDSAYDIAGGSNQDNYPLGDFLTANQQPIANILSISPTSISLGETVSFQGLGTDHDGSIIDYYWGSSIDGELSDEESFSTSSLSSGSHTITFKVKDNDNEWSSVKTYSSQIVVSSPSQKPTASITLPITSTFTYGDEIEFYGFGNDPDGGQIQGYQWRSSLDGIIGGSKSFKKSDLRVGQHTIYFKVRDDEGEWSNEVTKTLTIEADQSPENNNPIADASGPYSGYVNESITFDGSDSFDPDDDTLTFHWSFGDEEEGVGETTTHVYTTQGTYDITLIVTDSQGAQNTSTTFASITIEDENDDDDPSNGDTNGGENNTSQQDDGEDDEVVIPGFTILVFLLSTIIIVYFIRKK